MSTDTPWVKASRSAQSGDCVEMRRHDDVVEIRDTKARGEGPSLKVKRGAFAAWIEAAKRGRLDHLI